MLLFRQDFAHTPLISQTASCLNAVQWNLTHFRKFSSNFSLDGLVSARSRSILPSFTSFLGTILLLLLFMRPPLFRLQGSCHLRMEEGLCVVLLSSLKLYLMIWPFQLCHHSSCLCWSHHLLSLSFS